MTFRLAALAAMALCGLSIFISTPAEAAAPALTIRHERFELTLPDGSRVTSADMAGAVLETQEGLTLRIDAVTPAKERASVLLHEFSVLDPATKTWSPLCDADAYGRHAGFPVEGAWTPDGRYVAAPGRWFLACSVGSRGKCVLWGYSPTGSGPHGENLADYYRACQFAVRANYDGRGEAHTRNGTELDVADILGIETADSLTDPAYVFEAGWSPTGAVCVAATRWPDLLTRADLLRTNPTLDGPCEAADAKRRGALLLTRVKRR